MTHCYPSADTEGTVIPFAARAQVDLSDLLALPLAPICKQQGKLCNMHVMLVALQKGRVCALQVVVRVHKQRSKASNDARISRCDADRSYVRTHGACGHACTHTACCLHETTHKAARLRTCVYTVYARLLDAWREAWKDGTALHNYAGMACV